VSVADGPEGFNLAGQVADGFGQKAVEIMASEMLPGNSQSDPNPGRSAREHQDHNDSRSFRWNLIEHYIGEGMEDLRDVVGYELLGKQSIYSVFMDGDDRGLCYLCPPFAKIVHQRHGFRPAALCDIMNY